MNACDECLQAHKDWLESPTEYEQERKWANNHMASIMGTPAPSFDDFGDWLQYDDEDEEAA